VRQNRRTLSTSGEVCITGRVGLGIGFRCCCDAGDVYPTRFRVVSDGSKYGHDEWQYEKKGQWLPIPPDIIQRTETPTGQPVLVPVSLQ
jgi:hypothetical protein